MLNNALVAQWIEHRTSDPGVEGSNPSGRKWRCLKSFVKIYLIRYSGGGKNEIGGYGLVVECVLAKDETGVQFSLPAPSVSVLVRDKIGISPIKSFEIVDNSVDCVHKRHNGQKRQTNYR